MSSVVLDASALLCLLADEPGADRVGQRLAAGAYISAVNWAEVLTKIVDIGEEPGKIARELEEAGVAGGGLEIVPLTQDDALAVARLRQTTKQLGLSLGDRACLALAERLELPAVTTDRTWLNLNLKIPIEAVR